MIKYFLQNKLDIIFNTHMKKRLFKAKLVGIIFGLLELIGVVFFTFAFYFNIFGFKEYLTVGIVFISLGTAIILDIIYVWGIIFYFSKIRQKTDLKAADLIGSDIEEAYNFGMLGLAVVDENNIVLWTNTLFKEIRHQNIVKYYVF